MTSLDRRAVLRMSAAGGLAALQYPGTAWAQTAACVSRGLPQFLPNRLSVDCASKRNFSLFRRNTQYMGLTAVVSMNFVQGRIGTYPAGNLFLFPWLNKDGLALGLTRDWHAAVPTGPSTFQAAAPIRGWTLPLDEYFCNLVLQAPSQMFIGLRVGAPFKVIGARRGWYTDVEKLADGQGIGIAWDNSSLNAAWFGGSRSIPAGETCNGGKWRKLIIEAVNQASVPACA